jgi:hypothetical protein
MEEILAIKTSQYAYYSMKDRFITNNVYTLCYTFLILHSNNLYLTKNNLHLLKANFHL